MRISVEQTRSVGNVTTVRSTIVDQNCVREVVSFPPKRMRIPKQCYGIRLIVPNPVALTRTSNSDFRLQNNLNSGRFHQLFGWLIG